MPQSGLVASRVVVAPNFAILPPEGVPESTLPGWDKTAARILAAPAMGANFAYYLLDVQTGGGVTQTLDEDVEAFFYVMSGDVTLTLNGVAHGMKPGGYAYLSPGSAYTLAAKSAARLQRVKKVYEPLEVATRPADVVGNERDVKGEPFLEIQELLLKKLLPEDTAYDIAMNIFTFPPGFSLPMIETHVMEHGLYMLEGQGLYYLGDAWREVKADDFIWMGPYCPQSFYATSSSAARYIYYKNVNRDVEL
jgi:(S)-ureidoglycine aminohydrolase